MQCVSKSSRQDILPWWAYLNLLFTGYCHSSAPSVNNRLSMERAVAAVGDLPDQSQSTIMQVGMVVGPFLIYSQSHQHTVPMLMQTQDTGPDLGCVRVLLRPTPTGRDENKIRNCIVFDRTKKPTRNVRKLFLNLGQKTNHWT